MYRSKLVFSLAFVYLLLSGLQNTVVAQFERVDRIIRQLEEFTPGVSMTPDFLSRNNLADSEIYLVNPLEWEVRKLEFQRKFLESAKARLEEKNQSQAREMLNLRSELLELGVNDESSLQMQLQQNRENEIRLAGLQAQLSALKEAIDSQRSGASLQLHIDRQIIAEELRHNEKLIESLDEELKKKEKMSEQGVMPKHEVWSIRRTLENQLMQQRISKLKMAQFEQSPPLTPEQNQQLANVIAQIAQLESESKANTFNPAEIAEIYRGFLMDKRLSQDYENGVQKLSALEERLVEVEIELEYLTTILAHYREAFTKSKEFRDSQKKDANPIDNDD